MPVRSSTRKPVKRRSARKAPEESAEMQVAEIRHHHNIVDLKVAIALAFVVVSSMVITAYAKSPSASLTAATSTSSVVPTSTGRLLVSAKSDAETLSRVITPTTSTPVIVAKWTVASEVEPVKLDRVRFNAINGDYTVRTNAGEFGQFSLYENYGSTPLATAAYVGGIGNGYVEFNLSNFVVQPGQPRVLTLKSTINGSGIMKENSMIRFGVNLAAKNKWQAFGTNSGVNLDTLSIKFGATSYGMAALSSLHLYHNATPVVSATSPGTSSLELSSQAKVFAFMVNGVGDRELRLSKFLINFQGTGMNNLGVPTTTGVISGFKLYEANSSGQIGTLLASASGCLVAPKVGGSQFGTMVVPGFGNCSIGKAYISFDTNNDVNSALNNLTVPVDGMRRFIVVANTNNMLVGKTTSGTVTLTGQISGNTGTFPSSDPKKPFWSGGGIFYHYTPIGGKENTYAYNQTDSYPVMGYTLKRLF